MKKTRYFYLLIVGLALIASPQISVQASPATSSNEASKTQKTESGLEYIIIKEGTGAKPKKGDKVKVHYTGKLPDGTVFDSSRTRGNPIEFTLGVGQVIKGWDEGIALLKEGSQAKLTIPPALAYGARGVPPRIPPNATLIFEVELVKIEALK